MRSSRHLTVLAAFAAAACAGGDAPSKPDAVGTWLEYDTVVSVGSVDEPNPLLTFGYGTFALVDTTTLVHTASREPGRMVVVDLLSGTGWEISSDAGDRGPGEFGRRQPLVSESGDTIHAVAGGLYNAFSLSGDLLTTTRLALADPGPRASRQPVGFLGAGVVSIVLGSPADSAGLTIHAQTIEVDDPVRGTTGLSDVALPPMAFQRIEQEGGAVALTRADHPGGTARVDARGNTLMVVTMRPEAPDRLASYGPTGARLASVGLEETVSTAFLDASERVWIATGASNDRGERTWIVLDRALEELFRVAVNNVIDADGDMLLTLSIDRATGLQVLHLLRIQRP